MPVFEAILKLWLVALLLCWLFWHSIAGYLAQNYQIIDPLFNEPLWQMGADFGQKVSHETLHQILQGNDVNHANTPISVPKGTPITATNTATSEPIANAPSVSAINSTSATNTNPINPAMPTPPTSTTTPIALLPNDTVFFAGDSIMQGIALFAQRTLTSKGIKSINLAKVSTGLAYPKFFNWNKTIKTELNKQPIALIVIFIGTNDAQDMINGRTLLKFGSDEWRALYRARVDDIIKTANGHGTRVVWYLPPAMKSSKMHTRMQIIGQIIAEHGNTVTLINPSDELGNTFSEHIIIDDKKTRVRAPDGIHFTPKGYQLLADMLTQKLSLPPTD